MKQYTNTSHEATKQIYLSIGQTISIDIMKRTTNQITILIIESDLIITERETTAKRQGTLNTRSAEKLRTTARLRPLGKMNNCKHKAKG